MKANYNWDKGAENVFGFTSDYDVECWEFKNNTSDACLFTGEIPSKWSEDFEARYPDGYENIARFKVMHDWVVSTKQSDATGRALSSSYTDVDGNTHTHDTAEYRLAKFKTEFEDHFNMHYALIYYVYTFFALMVDQRAKNMFLTYWGSAGQWYFYFYDNDTCFGINNEGGLIFDYFHEDTDQLDGANIYNGQLSTLWVNFRQAFPDLIQETYQDLRSNSVLNYDELIDQFITKGSDKWSESVYNEDGDFKYISMLRSDNDATNLPQVRGTGEEHLKYFIENRLNYCDSKWYAGEYPEDIAVVRIYTPKDSNGAPRTDLVIPANSNITVTPYSAMYAGVRYKSNGTLVQERLDENETHTFIAPNEIFSDTETAIYGASQLSSLGDLAPLYLGYIDVGAATKLVELKIGDGTEGYKNENLYHLAVGTNRLLKKIDIQNCDSPRFNQALVLSGCPNIEEVYAKGSSITGVELPDSGYLKVLQLPATVSNLTLKNQLYIEDFSMEGYNSLKTVQCENCPSIDTLTILNNSPNVERVRLTNVDWEWDDASVLFELIDRDIAGIDENGVNTDTMWIDGKCKIKNITGAEFAEIKRLYPYLELSYETLASNLIFMSDDGTTELHRQTVANGGNGVDPVANGAIDAPIKESTAQYHFSFVGWSKAIDGDADETALLNVEGDRIVYAAYTKEIRSYTVNFYNGTTLLETHTIEYGKDATYGGKTPVKEGYTTAEFEFIGWSPSPVNIQEYTDCYAQYYDKREIAHGWNAIWGNCLDGIAESQYKIGSYKPVAIGAIDLPYDFYGRSAVVYNNEIHIIGGNTTNSAESEMHYKWNGVEWLEVGKAPYLASQSNAVVYNGEIHLLGSGNGVHKTKHYKYDGESWSQVSVIPYNFSSGAAVVYNNEIHIIGGDGNKTAHYKWDGSDWTSVSTLPVSVSNSGAVVYNNEIIIMVNNNLYKYNGSEWILAYEKFSTSVPYTAVVWNDEVYLLGCGRTDEYSKQQYKYDGTNIVKLDNLPVFFSTSSAVVYNDELYILGSRADYSKIFYKLGADSKWTPIGDYEIINFELVAQNHDELSSPTWKRVKVKNTYFGDANVTVSYNGKLHCISGTTHTTYDGTTIETLPTVPITVGKTNFRGVVWNNEIHIVGDLNGAVHYKYDGNEWTFVCNPSYSGETGANASSYGSTLAVYNDEMYRTVSTGNNKNLYKFDGTAWVEASTMPTGLYQGIMATYKNELHIIAGSAHYKWDGNEWIRASTVPYNTSSGSMVEYCGYLHLFGGIGDGFAHSKWNGSEWIRLDDMPDRQSSVTGSTAFIHNNELYLGGCGRDGSATFCSTIKYCDTSWIKVSNANIHAKHFVHNDKIYFNYGANFCMYDLENKKYVNLAPLPYGLAGHEHLVSYNGQLHAFPVEKYNGKETLHYIYDETNNVWNEGIAPPSGNYSTDIISYNGAIYHFGRFGEAGVSIYKYTDADGWVNTGAVNPTRYIRECSVVYNGLIHMFLGMHDNKITGKHYTFDGSTWTLIGNMPCSGVGSSIIVYDGKIHVLGTDENRKAHYVYDGVEWKEYEGNYSGIAYGYRRAVVCQNRIYATCTNSTSSALQGLYRLENPRASLTFLARNVLKDGCPWTTKEHMGTQFVSNKGGWETSYIRTYCRDVLYNNLPINLKENIKDVIKFSDKGCIDWKHNSNKTVDNIWLLAIHEMSSNKNFDCIANGVNTYPVFTDTNSMKRYRVDDDTLSASYWLRTSSPLYNTLHASAFAGEDSVFPYNNIIAQGEVDRVAGVLPGFCI